MIIFFLIHFGGILKDVITYQFATMAKLNFLLQMGDQKIYG